MVATPAVLVTTGSLSARRAWIEMLILVPVLVPLCVALRKESVDRNAKQDHVPVHLPWSLSARRAWIEIFIPFYYSYSGCVALRKESVDRNGSDR